MPIVERDPWRDQYFTAVSCPDNVVIPTDDELAYQRYPRHRWIYNKLLICETQGLDNAPHDIMPPQFPVFSKPIYNLRGMGCGSKIIESAEQYRAAIEPGYMWMALLSGDHVSSDAAVIDGKPVIPPDVDPNKILAISVKNLTGPILGGFMAASVLATNSLDAQFLVLGNMFTNDIVVHFAGKKRFSDRQLLTIGRAFVVGAPSDVQCRNPVMLDIELRGPTAPIVSRSVQRRTEKVDRAFECRFR